MPRASGSTRWAELLHRGEVAGIAETGALPGGDGMRNAAARPVSERYVRVVLPNSSAEIVDLDEPRPSCRTEPRFTAPTAAIPSLRCGTGTNRGVVARSRGGTERSAARPATRRSSCSAATSADASSEAGTSRSDTRRVRSHLAATTKPGRPADRSEDEDELSPRRGHPAGDTDGQHERRGTPPPKRAEHDRREIGEEARQQSTQEAEEVGRKDRPEPCAPGGPCVRGRSGAFYRS